MSKLIQTNSVSTSKLKMGEKLCLELVELLTPRNDQNVTSPQSIHTLPSKQIMRILKTNQVELFILI